MTMRTVTHNTQYTIHNHDQNDDHTQYIIMVRMTATHNTPYTIMIMMTVAQYTLHNTQYTLHNTHS